MIEISKKLIMTIEAGISWHGLDKYLGETDDLTGTVLERDLHRYLDARENLLKKMREYKIEY